MIDLIYCAGGNARLAKIAIDAGLLYGSRLPGRPSHPIQFADQDWKRPNRAKYIAALAKYRPAMCTVLDLEREDQLSEVMSWAEEAAQYVQTVIIIPKVMNIIARIPRTIGGKEIRLGVPCGPHEQTAPPRMEFQDRPVHILGGQPHKQMKKALDLNVKSVDCSTTAYMARKLCAFWAPSTIPTAKSRWWPQLKDIGLGDYGRNAYQEAFRLSCINIISGWHTFTQTGLHVGKKPAAWKR